MLKLNFNETLVAANAVMESHNVPLIYGHAGIGKSQMAEQIVSMHNDAGDKMKLEKIFGSLLGEKELGGIPSRTEKTLKPTQKQIEEAGGIDKVKPQTVKVNDYTVHDTILKIINNDREGYKTLLFIDEINRCDRTVQNELMQLVLEKRVNNIKLPTSVMIMCAGNLESDDCADYQVNVMNDALKDRFWQVELNPSLKDWLVWALNNDIDNDVIDYLSEYNEDFIITTGDEDIKPTPRSWEMVSQEKKILSNIHGDLAPNDNTLYYMACGHVGGVIGNKFFNFLKEKKNPMIKPEEFFRDKNNDNFKKLLNKLSCEAIPRMTVTVNRTIKYLSELKGKEMTALHKERFTEILKAVPKDFMIGCMQNISANYKSLHKVMESHEDYIDLYFEIDRRARNLAKG
jgi:hypothetical protein